MTPETEVVIAWTGVITALVGAFAAYGAYMAAKASERAVEVAERDVRERGLPQLTMSLSIREQAIGEVLTLEIGNFGGVATQIFISEPELFDSLRRFPRIALDELISAFRTTSEFALGVDVLRPGEVLEIPLIDMEILFDQNVDTDHTLRALVAGDMHLLFQFESAVSYMHASRRIETRCVFKLDGTNRHRVDSRG